MAKRYFRHNQLPQTRQDDGFIFTNFQNNKQFYFSFTSLQVKEINRTMKKQHKKDEEKDDLSSGSDTESEEEEDEDTVCSCVVAFLHCNCFLFHL
jgi:hypothetical protein